MGEMGNAYTVLVEESKGTDHLENTVATVRIILK
jgi:hypothetical protein